MEWFILLIAETIAVFRDIHTRKIPNGLILTEMLLSLFWNLHTSGGYGLWMFFTGMGTALLLLGVLHFFRMLGAGDLKLLLAAGSVLGPKKLSLLLVLVFLIAAVYAIAVLTRHRILMRRLSYLISYMQRLRLTRTWEPYIKDDEDEAYLYFSIPILLGTVMLWSLVQGGVL